jgi:hypothetical protein
LAKARIPKLQENLLKRTAKIETQAGAACKTEISYGKEVLLQLKAKKDNNAEVEERLPLCLLFLSIRGPILGNEKRTDNLSTLFVTVYISITPTFY